MPGMRFVPWWWRWSDFLCCLWSNMFPIDCNLSTQPPLNSVSWSRCIRGDITHYTLMQHSWWRLASLTKQTTHILRRPCEKTYRSRWGRSRITKTQRSPQMHRIGWTIGIHTWCTGKLGPVNNGRNAFFIVKIRFEFLSCKTQFSSSFHGKLATFWFSNSKFNPGRRVLQIKHWHKCFMDNLTLQFIQN